MLCMASLLPKLRDHFAEFLNDASSVGLRILSSSTCVGLRYGYHVNDSGFSRHAPFTLSYYLFGRPRTCLFEGGFSCPPGSSGSPGFPSPVVPHACVPAVLSHGRAGISTSCPSATSLDLTLGPAFPRVDRLYPGNLRYSAWRILTSISLLIPAFSLHARPRILTVPLLPCINAPLPTFLFLSFGVVF